jgi:hypothetical protein
MSVYSQIILTTRPVFSGTRNFELLSEEEKRFALHTMVQYAPRAYEWIKDCKATDDGLSIACTGREKAESDLPPFEREKVHSFPVSHPDRLAMSVASYLLTPRRWFGATSKQERHPYRSRAAASKHCIHAILLRAKWPRSPTLQR